MNSTIKKILPVGVIAIGVISAALIINSKPTAVTDTVVFTPKQVKVLVSKKETIRINVEAQGTVAPGTKTVLVSQVGGQILSVSESFDAGGFFEKDDVLVRIDPSDYKLAVAQMQLQVAQTELRLSIEQQEAKVALQEWKKLNSGEPTDLAARVPQLKEARRALAAANAGLAQAELNLTRTKIKAPYSGRIRAKSVDIGQFVNPGMAVANIYGVDAAEVRLPIRDSELAYLDFPLDFRGLQNRKDGPIVTLTAEFAGQQQEWKGYLTRIESEIDARSRMIYVVAKVNDPYNKSMLNGKQPLTVGLFVTAKIEGKEFEEIVRIPRSAIRNDNQLMIVDSNNKLRFRDVVILKMSGETAYIIDGLEDDDKICITPITTAVDGMAVEVYEEVVLPDVKVDGDSK